MWCINLKTLLSSSSSSKEATNEDDEAAQRRQQKRVNRLIEKQLRQDQKRLRATHTIQLVGLDGSGKSVVIKQMATTQGSNNAQENNDEKITTTKNDDDDDDDRAAIGRSIRHSARAALLTVLKSLKPEAISDPENRSRRQWVLDHITDSEHLNDDEDPFVSQPLLSVYAASLLKESAARRFLAERPHDLQLQSAKYFLGHRINSMSDKKSSFPDEQDLLRHYRPTRSLLEASVRIEEVTFRLCEIKSSGSSCFSWLNLDPDATAVIFVVDVGAFDVVLEEKSGLCHLRHAMRLFREFWKAPPLRNKSVVLLLNKEEVFEKKIRLDGCRNLKKYFPEYDNAHSNNNAALPTSGEVIVDRAKAFVRDCFLQLADYNQDVAHHCYIHYACALEGARLRATLHEAFKDILQREHLRMHEIL